MCTWEEGLESVHNNNVRDPGCYDYDVNPDPNLIQPSPNLTLTLVKYCTKLHGKYLLIPEKKMEYCIIMNYKPELKCI